MAIKRRVGLRPPSRPGVKNSGVYPGSGMPSGAQVAKGGNNTAGSGRRTAQPVSPIGNKVFKGKRPGLGGKPAARAKAPGVGVGGASLGRPAKPAAGRSAQPVTKPGATPKPAVNIFDAQYAADRATGEREVADSLTEARARLAAMQNGNFDLYNKELSAAKAQNASHTYDANAGLAARGIFSSGSRDVAHKELADAMAAREIELNDAVGMNAANRLRGEITAAETSGLAELLERLAGEAAGRKGEEEAAPSYPGKTVKSAGWLANDRKRALARQKRVAAAKRKGR